MTTQITAVYDALVSAIETVLPNHKRLTNPYDLTYNSEYLLDQGFGVAIGPATNAELKVCDINTTREFVVSITRKFYATDHDADAKASSEKALLEDFFLVINQVEQNTSLNDNDTVGYVSDSGIIKVFDESDNFIAVQGNFSVTYFDNYS